MYGDYFSSHHIAPSSHPHPIIRQSPPSLLPTTHRNIAEPAELTGFFFLIWMLKKFMLGLLSGRNLSVSVGPRRRASNRPSLSPAFPHAVMRDLWNIWKMLHNLWETIKTNKHRSNIYILRIPDSRARAWKYFWVMSWSGTGGAWGKLCPTWENLKLRDVKT